GEPHLRGKGVSGKLPADGKRAVTISEQHDDSRRINTDARGGVDDVQFSISVEVGNGDLALRNKFGANWNCRWVGDLARGLESTIAIAEHNREKGRNVLNPLQITPVFHEEIDIAVAIKIAVAHDENTLKRLRGNRRLE